MSTTSKITFASSLVASIGIIGYIYYQQQADRNRLYAGVARDVQRQQQRKIENTYVLQQQIELTKHLKNLEQKELEASELKDTSA